jgi:hypothetical protein
MEPPRKERRRSADEDRLTGHRRREPAARPTSAADPIFSRPYEPGMAPAAKPAPPSGPQKRSPQVAALLGGFKKAS